jgi:hypothetical protein
MITIEMPLLMVVHGKLVAPVMATVVEFCGEGHGTLLLLIAGRLFGMVISLIVDSIAVDSELPSRFRNS